MSQNIIQKEIYDLLCQHFSGSVHVNDDSHLHIGHVGYGKGHYTVHIVDDKFADLTRMQRHRLVYEILSDYTSSKIHALALKLYSPYEYASSNDNE
jgi:BolA family transcriptional regulator, general stress-responsive regulator